MSDQSLDTSATAAAAAPASPAATDHTPETPKPKPGAPAPAAALDYTWGFLTGRDKYRREDGGYDYQKMHADLLQTSINKGLPVARGDASKTKAYLKKELGKDYDEKEVNGLLRDADKQWASYEKGRFNSVRTSWQSPIDSPFTKAKGFTANKTALDTRPQDERLGRWGLQMHGGKDGGEDAADVLKKYNDAAEGTESGKSLYRRTEAETQLMFNNYQRDRQVMVGVVDEKTGTRDVLRDPVTGLPVKKMGPLNPKSFHTQEFDADGEPRLVEWDQDTDPNHLKGELLNVQGLLPKPAESTVASAVLGSLTMGALGNHEALGANLWDYAAKKAGYDPNRVSLKSSGGGAGQAMAEFNPLIQQGFTNLKGFAAGLDAQIQDVVGNEAGAKQSRANQREAYREAAQQAPNLNIDARGSMFSNLPSFAHNLSQQGGQQLVQQSLNAVTGGTLGFAYMAATSAEQGYTDGRKAGLGEGQATALAAVLGIVTYGTEHILDPKLWAGAGKYLRGAAGKAVTSELTQAVTVEQKNLIGMVAKELEKQGLAQSATAAQVETVARKFVPGLYQNLKGKFDGVAGLYGGLKERLEKTAVGGMVLEAGQEFVQEGLDQVAQTGAYAGARQFWLEDEQGNPRPSLTGYQKEALKDGSSPLAEKSWSAILDETTQAMLGGAFAGGLFAAPFAWSNAKSAREAQEHAVEANQTAQFASYLVNGKFDERKADELRTEIGKWRDRGQLGPQLGADNQPVDDVAQSQNHLNAQLLLNKVNLLQGLGKSTDLDKLVNGKNNDALSALLTQAASGQDGAERIQQGLGVLYQTVAKKQQIQRLLQGRPAGQLSADGELLPGDGQDAPGAAGGRPGVQPGLVLGMSAEAYAQEVAARRAALEGAEAGADGKPTDATLAATKLLEQQVLRAKDPGALGVITRNPDANAYYESRVLERELSAQIEAAPTNQEENALRLQLAQQQDVSAEALQKAQASSADNAPLQKVLEITHAQLELDDALRQQGKLFNGEAVAAHIVSGTVDQYVAEMGKMAVKQPLLAEGHQYLLDALSNLDNPVNQLQTLTRWHKQYQADAPALVAAANTQAVAAAQAATQGLTNAAQQLPTLSLATPEGAAAAAPVVEQLDNLARNAGTLAVPDEAGKHLLAQALTQEAERLQGEARAALAPEAVEAEVNAQLPGAVQRLAELDAQAAMPEGEDDADLAEQQHELAQQIDQVRDDVRTNYQHPVAAQLLAAAALVQALPVQDTEGTVTAAPAPDQLESDFYTGRHTGLSEPGELAKQAQDWASRDADALATRKEESLAALEEQAQFNRLHLELRRALGEALHQPGTLPKGTAAKFLSPISGTDYQAASKALDAVTHDLKTARAKFGQAAGSRFAIDDELASERLRTRYEQLGTVAQLAAASTNPVLGPLKPVFDGLAAGLDQLRLQLASDQSPAVAAAVTQAEETLRTALGADPAAWPALVNELLQNLPEPSSAWNTTEASKQRGRFAESTAYVGTSYDGILTYLNTLAGISPVAWAGAYQRVAQQLVGTDAQHPGKLPSLEQQAVIHDINGFLTGADNVAMPTDSQLAADEAQQQKSPKARFKVGRHVLYVPGSAGTGKTKMVIRVAMQVQAALAGRSAATRYKVVATAPHVRQQQTLTQQLTADTLAVSNQTVAELTQALAQGTLDADAIVLDEGTILADEQVEALLRAHAAFNEGRSVPVRLVVLGDAAQMAGRNSKGNRSDRQFFVNHTQRFVLSTRPLANVYRTGLVTAFDLFNELRARILSDQLPGADNRTMDVSPVAGMRYSQAGNDVTTLQGVKYQRSDEQRREAAQLINALQARGDQRRVALITSRELVESEVAALRKLGVQDAASYVLAAEDQPDGSNLGGIVKEVDHAQGDEYAFVFVAVDEKNQGDGLGTPKPDGRSTLRAINVGATRMMRYASVRHDGSTGDYANQQVGKLEEFGTESVADTQQRNRHKLDLLAQQSGVRSQPLATPNVAPDKTPKAPADLSADQRERQHELERLRDDLDEQAIQDAIAGPQELNWENVQLARAEGDKLEALMSAGKALAQSSDAQHPELAASLDDLRAAYRRHAAGQQLLASALNDRRAELLEVPADVLPPFGGDDDGRGAVVLENAPHGGAQVTVVLPAGSQAVAQPATAFDPAPVLQLDEQGVHDLFKAADAIKRGAALVLQQRALQPDAPVPAERVGGCVGPSVVQATTIAGMALEGRVLLQHYGGVEEAEGRANPRALQANQALQARIVQHVGPQTRENPRRAGQQLRGYGTLRADNLAGLPIPGRNGEFTGNGEFFVSWHPVRAAYGQGGPLAYKQNAFAVEYREGHDKIGIALIYKDGAVEAVAGTVHVPVNGAAPFDAALQGLQQAPGTRLSLGAALPLERVNHPHYSDLNKSGGASADVQGEFDYDALRAGLAKHGLAVSSPWVITVTAKDNVSLGNTGTMWAKPTEPGEDESDGLASVDVPNVKHISGSTVAFVQRAGVQALSSEAIDAVVAKAIMAKNPKDENRPYKAKQVVENLFDEYGLEMQHLRGEGRPTQLTDYFDSLQQQVDAPVPTTVPALRELLRSALDARGRLVLKDGASREGMPAWERTVKQMLFSPTQFEFMADRNKPAAERRGLRGKLLGHQFAGQQFAPGVLETAGLVQRTLNEDGGVRYERGPQLTKFFKGSEATHFLALVDQLAGEDFSHRKGWDAVLGAWPEDLFRYLTYLDQKTAGAVSKAWKESNRVHPVQVRFYGGASNSDVPHTRVFSRVQAPVGLPLSKRIGGTRLTMNTVSTVLDLEGALLAAAPAQVAPAVQQTPAPAAPVAAAPVATPRQPAPVGDPVGGGRKLYFSSADFTDKPRENAHHTSVLEVEVDAANPGVGLLRTPNAKRLISQANGGGPLARAGMSEAQVAEGRPGVVALVGDRWQLTRPIGDDTAANAPAVEALAAAAPVPAPTATPQLAEPAASATNGTGQSRRRANTNAGSAIQEGDAHPAEAEARLRDLFGDELQFELNTGVTFLKELGVTVGNLIALATDTGTPQGRVDFATANHEAIHRVLRIVSPAYRAKLLAAMRVVLTKEDYGHRHVARLADDEYVEEQLARYYPHVAKQYRPVGEAFKDKAAVQFLQGFAAGRVVLRALQAIAKAAGRLRRNPDYLAELFGDMEKGYYRERSLRQRYEEEKAYNLNNAAAGRNPRAQRQQDLDSLETVLGGLDSVYDWLDRVRNGVYDGMYRFDPSRSRRSLAESRAGFWFDARNINAEIVAEYGEGNLPGVEDVDNLRAEDAQWVALTRAIERPGPVDEEGQLTVRQTTPLDVLMDFAFAHLGTSLHSEQGVDRDEDAAREAVQGTEGEENSARVAAAQAAAAEGTSGIPAWEKEREARQGANLDMHVDSTLLYTVQGWSDATSMRDEQPMLVRDAAKRYIDPRLAQSVLDEAFSRAQSNVVARGSDELQWEGVRAGIYGQILNGTGDGQATAASLYLKFFNAHPPIPGTGAPYIQLTDPEGKQRTDDLTPVSFFEAVRPKQAGNVQVHGLVRNQQSDVLASYAGEYQRALSELMMHYRSAENKAAVSYNTLSGVQGVGVKYRLNRPGIQPIGAEYRSDNQQKEQNKARMSGVFLQQHGDGRVTIKPSAIAAFEKAGFSFADATVTGGNGELGQPAVMLSYQGHPFLRWQLPRQGHVRVVGVSVKSALPLTELAKVYGKALALAGVDVDAQQLGQVMQDRRNEASQPGRPVSILGFQNSQVQVPELITKIWSEALGQHLVETGNAAHPAAKLLTDPRYNESGNLTDVRRDLLGPARNETKPLLMRSPLSAWQQVESVGALLTQWQKGGQQSSVRTADGKPKFLRRFAASAAQRLRTLDVWREYYTQPQYIDGVREHLAQGYKGEISADEKLARVPDAGLGWVGTSAGQPARWVNKVLSGELIVLGRLELAVLENPLTGKKVDIVKAGKGEQHDVAAWGLFWKMWSDTGGQRFALPSPPKADKTTQEARLISSGRNLAPVYKYADPATDAALRELHGSYVAQFYGSVAKRWADAKLDASLRFTAPAGFEALPLDEAAGVLKAHILSRDATLLRRSPLREGVDYYVAGGALKGFSPALNAALAMSPAEYAADVKASIPAEAQRLIDQGISAPPRTLSDQLYAAGDGGYKYDPERKFRNAHDQRAADKLKSKDGQYHPLLLDYLVTHRILAQHLDTAMTGHHIYYPKGPVDMAKRGVLDHTAYEAPDVDNPRGLPRTGRVLVMDDLKLGATHAESQHTAQFQGLLRGLGMSEAAVQKAIDGQDNQDGLGFMDPLHWRLERESQGMKYPLREQIKNIQGGMLADGTPFLFKNSYLVLSNNMLDLGNDRVWNMVAQSLGGYGSPLYKRWLELRAPMSPQQLAREEDWDQLHEEFVQSRLSGGELHAGHIGRVVLASGNKVAPHSVQDMNDAEAHRGAFEVDNLLGGRVLSLYQNPTNSSIANVTQENHILAVGGENYRSMHRIYDLLGQLAYSGLDQLKAEVDAAAKQAGDNQAYFYQKAIDSLTALGNISNTLSLARAHADENVPLLQKQLMGAIASTVNAFTVKQRMNGLRATVATMTGLMPMYDAAWTDADGVAQQKRYTKAQLLKRELVTVSDATTGPPVVTPIEGVTLTQNELKFVRLVNTKEKRDASPEEAQAFMAALEAGDTGTSEALIAQHGYELAGQEILVPRELATSFGIKPGDDVVDVNEAGAAYFADAPNPAQAWANWQEFLLVKSTRVPVTNMNSTQMSQVVGFLDGHGNTILTPSETEIVSGVDNDGDQTTAEMLKTGRGGRDVAAGSDDALRTELFREKKARFSDPRNLNQLVKPLSNDEINDLAKKAAAAQAGAGSIDYGVSQGFHAHSRNIDVLQDNQQGKAGVGPFVKVRETFNNLYALARANPGVAALTSFGLPSYLDGEAFGSIVDRATRVMATLEELANGALDNAKNATLGPLNINDYTFSAYGAAGVMGWSLPQMIGQFNHPAVRAVVQNLQQANSVYTRKADEIKLIPYLQGELMARFGVYEEVEEEGFNGPRTRRLSSKEITEELGRKITEAHQAGTSVNPDNLAVEHFFLMSARGDELLKIQRVLSPMTGVDAADYDSEQGILRLTEALLGEAPTVGKGPSKRAMPLEQVERVLEQLLDAPGEAQAGHLMVDPLAVLHANKQAVAGARAMLVDSAARRQSQILRQTPTREAFFGTLRQVSNEAKGYKMHAKLQQAFDAILDSRFLSKQKFVAVPAAVLSQEAKGTPTRQWLNVLAQSDLGTLVGRHSFLEAAAQLLFQVKTEGSSNPAFFGGLGQSALLRELSFDGGDYGILTKLANATEMDPAVKNKLEREFNKLARIHPDYGKLVQDVLVTYQLLSQGLYTGRGSFAEIFGPQALAAYSADRGAVQSQAKAGRAVVSPREALGVLVQHPALVPQLVPRRAVRLSEEEQLLRDEMEALNEQYGDGTNLGPQTETEDDNTFYGLPEAGIPAVLSNDFVTKALNRRELKAVEAQAANRAQPLVRQRNKAAGDVLYQLDPLGKKWVRQFVVGNPAVNSQGLRNLSSLPVYQAVSPREDLNHETNDALREYLKEVRAYARQAEGLQKQGLLNNPALRLYDKFGRELAITVQKVCG